MKCSHKYSMNHMLNAESYRIMSLRITVASILTPVRYENHTEIFRSYVNKRRIWYKTCDDTVATIYVFS